MENGCFEVEAVHSTPHWYLLPLDGAPEPAFEMEMLTSMEWAPNATHQKTPMECKRSCLRCFDTVGDMSTIYSKNKTAPSLCIKGVFTQND